MRVLLVEPYLGGSHADWAHGLARHSAHEVSVVGHPGRHWRWRMRGGPVTLAEQAAGVVAEHGRPDVVLVSGMTGGRSPLRRRARGTRGPLGTLTHRR